MAISKIIRITSYSILFFSVFFILIATLFNNYLNKKLGESLKKQISESTHHEYQLSFDKLSVNLFNQSINVSNLIIAPSKKETEIKTQYFFKTNNLRIINFSIISYLKDNSFLINKVEFEKPQISIFLSAKRFPINTTNNKNSLYTTISKKLNSISINHINISNSIIIIYKNRSNTTPIFSSNNNSISIKKFLIDSITDKKNRLFFAEKFEVIMNKFYYHFSDSLYSLHGKRLYASYTDSILIIDSLKLIPNFSKKEFATKAGRQTSRTEMLSSKIICKKMDVKSFFEFNTLFIHKVELLGNTIDVFRDNTVPLAHIVRPSLQSIIKKVPFFISVDTIEMKNAKLVFEVLNPGTFSKGKISINKMNVIVSGIKNDTLLYNDNQHIKILVTGYVYDKGKFTETLTFPLKDTNKLFSCSGSITSMPLSVFNSIIRPFKNASFSSGQLDSASFSFIAYQNSSSGIMKFAYHNLTVDLLNKFGKKTGLKEQFKSLVANKFIIKSNNPESDGKIRVSKIYAKHNRYRYFINYSMQSILSGIEPTIMGNKKIKWLKDRK